MKMNKVGSIDFFQDYKTTTKKKHKIHDEL